MTVKARIPEVAIQRTILDGLTYLGWLAWRSQAIPVPIRRGRQIVGLRAVDPHLVGIPDVMALKGGRFLGCEVKSETGKQTREQARWQERIRRAGGMYILARSWDDVEQALRTGEC